MAIEFKKAIRKAVPLLVGLVGPSGTGKTFSALRMAKGIQKVTGGRIKVVDTENDRALQYADFFDFDHFSFKPPFSSLRYLEVIKAASETPGPLVIDSTSHEHEGEGGYIWLHDQEVERLVSKGGFSNEYAAQVPAWGLPAKNRGKLINGILQYCKTAIFCFRSKEKVNMDAKKTKRDGSVVSAVESLGWMPIAGDAFIYEMTLKLLLRPGADGIPTLMPEYEGEKATTKIPIHFRDLIKQTQLSEAVGEMLAKWAAGTKDISAEDRERWNELNSLYPLCSSPEGYKDLESRREKLWLALDVDMKAALKFTAVEAGRRLGLVAAATSPPASPPPPSKPAGHTPGVDDPMYDDVPR